MYFCHVDVGWWKGHKFWRLRGQNFQDRNEPDELLQVFILRFRHRKCRVTTRALSPRRVHAEQAPGGGSLYRLLGSGSQKPRTTVRLS